MISDILTTCEECLKRHERPLSVARLRTESSALREISENALVRILRTAAKDPELRIRVRTTGNLEEFYLSDSPAPDRIYRGEYRFYQPLRSLLERMGHRVVVLEHTTARREERGAGTWRYPDLVGIRGAALIGYEVKAQLNMAGVRKSFFQCLSNSIWANERYVVVPQAAISDGARAEFETLARILPVGLISLRCDPDLLNAAAPDVYALEILMQCPDGDREESMVQNLKARWPEFAEALDSLGLR